MRILSVATHRERLFDCFVESAKRHNIPLDILGEGMQWKGFGWRWSLINKHLETIDEDELILVTDAFDSIILKDASAFETAFAAYDSPIVFSTEPPSREFYAIARYYRYKIFGEDPIINGGTYIGQCKHIRYFISRLKMENDTDDQRFLTCLYKHIHMTVDFKFNIMYHCVGWRKNIDTLPDACIVTFPADGYNKKILKQLGYEYKDNHDVNITWRRILHYGKFFWLEIFIILWLINPCIKSV